MSEAAKQHTEEELITLEAEGLTLPALVEQSIAMRNDAAKLEKEASALKADKKIYDRIIRQRIEDLGLERTAVNTKFGEVVAVPSSRTNYQIVGEEKQELYDFIRDNNLLHLFYSRLSSAACEEAERNLGKLPGTHKYVEPSLNLRVSKSK